MALTTDSSDSEWFQHVLNQLGLIWGEEDEVIMRRGKVFRDIGMDPVIVIIYDVVHKPAPWRDITENKIERRIAVVQGFHSRGSWDGILTYMEGW